MTIGTKLLNTVGGNKFDLPSFDESMEAVRVRGALVIGMSSPEERVRVAEW